MRFHAFLGWGLAASLGLALGAMACGDDSNGTTTDNDGGSSDGSDDATPIVDAPYGLDTRPANTTCLAPDRPTTNTAVKWVQVFNTVNLGQVMRLVQAPGDNSRFFLATRDGKVKTFAATGASGDPTVVFDVNAGKANVADQLQAGGEGGLLGIALHPNFAQNGYLFLSYTIHDATQPPPGGSADMRSVITRVHTTNNGASFGEETTIFGPFDQPASNHDGGSINFGLDGNLYIGFGDGGGGGDTFNHGQDTTTPFSKILRLDVDHPANSKPYGIPADNPFANSTTNLKEIFAYGFRNPFRWSFDRGTGDLWLADVGQDAYEEVDKVKLGGNYGWHLKEGFHCYSAPGHTTGDLPCNIAGLVDPIYEYSHATGHSITGGYVYRGKAIPQMVGAYIFGDFVNQQIWSLVVDPSTGKPVVTQLNTSGPGGGWSSFAEDNDGELYALDLSGAKIYKMVAADPPDAGAGVDAGAVDAGPLFGRPLADRLSATGCVDPNDTSKPASGVIPYTVNSPLWSDGAEKRRFFAIPDGSQIHVDADGDWEFPIGTVMMKEFSVAGKRTETRLFVRHADGAWGGYSYEWDDAGKDAYLLPSNKTKQVGAQSWYFPSRSECGSCHTEAAKHTLGPEDGQLNGLFVYDSTHRRSNQIATLDHIGIFDAPHASPDMTAVYPVPTAGGPAEASAKSYLHSNCSFCHRPQGGGGGNMDFRFATAFGDMKACGQPASTGDLGVPGLQVFAPGDPSHSAMSLRPHALDAKRMPPLATHMVDTAGTAVIDSWITSVKACPPPSAGLDGGDGGD